MTWRLGVDGFSRIPRNNIPGKGSQRPGRHARLGEMSAPRSGPVAPLRAPRSFHTQHADVGGLRELGISPRRLSQLSARPRGVENIVGDLKRETDVFTELPSAFTTLGGASAAIPPEHARGAG